MLRSRPRRTAAPSVTVLALAGLALGAAAPACRCGSGGGESDASASADAGPRIEPFVRDAEPRLGGDGGVDPACSGTELDLASVVVDPRCAIDSTRARQLRALLEAADGGALPLRQDARVTSEGRIELRLVNRGGVPLTLPLSFHAKLPAFTALAEDEKFTLYELAPPRLEVAAAPDPGANDAAGGDGAEARRDRPHFARIVLAPGGSAVATVAVVPEVASVMRRGKGDPCADASTGGDGGACSPTRLRQGRYTLHIGELLTDVEAGPPARVSWEAR